MSSPSPRMVRDPTLYRIFSIIGWVSLETSSESANRLEWTEQALRHLGWLIDGEKIPRREELEGRQRKLWDNWREEGEGWNVHRFAQSYQEEIMVLLGVEQDGLHPEPDDWVPQAQNQWSRIFGRG